MLKSIFRSPYSNATGSKYDVFISYAHADLQYATQIQTTLERFCRPLLSLKAMHVFRDETDLNAGLLSQTIKNSINSSNTFLLLATPNSAKSRWVEKEITAFWKRQRRLKEEVRICIVLLEGKSPWTDSKKEINNENLALNRRYTKFLLDKGIEPRILDLRDSIDKTGKINPKSPPFLDAIASIGSIVWNVDKRNLFGHQKKLKRQITNSLVIVVIFLFFATGGVLQKLLDLSVSEAKQFTVKAEGLVEVKQYDKAMRVALAAFNSGGLFTQADGSTERILALAASKSNLFDLLTHPNKIYKIDFNKEGNTAATAINRIGDRGNDINEIWMWKLDKLGHWSYQLIGRHRDIVLDLQFSEDEKLLVSVGLGGSALLYEKDTENKWNVVGQQIFSRGISDVTLGLTKDSEQFFVGADNGLWHFKRGDSASWASLLIGHEGEAITKIQVSTSGQQILTTLKEKLYLWSKSDEGVWQSVQLNNEGERVADWVFYPDGSKFITTGHSTKLWQRQGLDLTYEVLPNDSYVGWVWVSPDDHKIYTRNKEGQLKVWRKDDEKGWDFEVLDYISPFRNITPLNDGQLVAITQNNEILIWNNSKTNGWQHRVIGSLDSTIFQTIKAGNGKIATVDMTGNAKIWSHLLSGPKVQTMADNNVGFSKILIASSRKFFITIGNDGTLRKWYGDGKQWISEVISTKLENYSRLVASTDGKVVAISSYNSRSMIWTANSSGGWSSFELPSNIVGIAISPNGQYVIAEHGQGANANHGIYWWKKNGDKWDREILPACPNTCFKLAVSNDGATVVASPDLGIPVLIERSLLGKWKRTTLSRQLTIGRGAGDSIGARQIDALAMTPDASLIVLALQGMEPILFSKNLVGERDVLALAGIRARVSGIEFSSDQKTIVVKNGKYVLVSERNKEGEWTNQLLDDHHHKVKSISFSQDKNRIISTSSKNEVNVWERDSGGEWSSQQLQNHNMSINAAFFDNTDKNIISISLDGAINKWTSPWLLPINRQKNLLGILFKQYSNEIPELVCKQKLRGELSIITSTDVEAIPLLFDFNGVDVCLPFRQN